MEIAYVNQKEFTIWRYDHFPYLVGVRVEAVVAASGRDKHWLCTSDLTKAITE